MSVQLPWSPGPDDLPRGVIDDANDVEAAVAKDNVPGAETFIFFGSGVFGNDLAGVVG